jgi:hypothetical protein
VFDEIDAVRSGLSDHKRANSISKLVGTAHNGVKLRIEVERFAQLKNGDAEETTRRLLSLPPQS